MRWMAIFDPEMLRELLAEAEGTEAMWGQWDGYFAKGHPEGVGDGAAAQAMRADAERYLVGDLNTKVDRASMATGLEVRCPFQDHKVVELAYSLPTRWRQRGRVGKYILRRACGDLLPSAVARRPKRGFGVPVGAWFRRELRELFRDTVLSKRGLERGYFRREAIERLVEENDRQQEDHGHRLWALLMLELWHRRYIDG